MGPQNAFDVLAVKLHLSYDDHCVAALGGDGVQPTRFGDWIAWVPFCLYVNGADDRVTGAVSLIIFG